MVEAAFDLLSVVSCGCRSPHGDGLLADMSPPPYLLAKAALRRHPAHAALVAASLRLLGDACGCAHCEQFWGSDSNSEYAERTRAAGLYHELVAAMEAFPAHPGVQRAGLDALWWLQFDSSDGSLVCMHRKSNALFPPAERIFKATERALGVLVACPPPPGAGGRAVTSSANLLTEFFRRARPPAPQARPALGVPALGSARAG